MPRSLLCRGSRFQSELRVDPSLFHHHAFNAARVSCRFITIYHHPTEPYVTTGSLEAGRHIVQESRDDQFLLDSNDAVVRAGHAHVSDVGSSSGEYTLIRRGNMGVGADNYADAAIEIPSHGNF